jgi:hypothetical protein
MFRKPKWSETAEIPFGVSEENGKSAAAVFRKGQAHVPIEEPQRIVVRLLLWAVPDTTFRPGDQALDPAYFPAGH